MLLCAKESDVGCITSVSSLHLFFGEKQWGLSRLLESVVAIELSQVSKFLAEAAFVSRDWEHSYGMAQDTWELWEGERCQLIKKVSMYHFLVDMYLFSVITLVLKSMFLTSAPMTSFLTIIYYKKFYQLHLLYIMYLFIYTHIQLSTIEVHH